MSRKVILVSGAGGFIGRWSVPQLIARGYEVHAVLRRCPESTAPSPSALRGAEIHRADMLDADSVDTLMAKIKPSHLLHFAWIATPGVYWESPDNYRWLAAGRHLLQSFRDHDGVRAVMAGTCAEYDWSRAGVCDERSTPLASDGGALPTPYASCKIALQNALETFGRDRHASTAWGRVFFLYGPHEHPARLVASVIVRLLSGSEAPCSHGRQIRDFLHVADVGSAFAAIVDSDVVGPINIGSGVPLSIAELLGEIGKQIGRPELVRLGARVASPSEPPLLIPAVRRLSHEIGWTPHFDLSAGLADTIAWWRKELGNGHGEAIR